MSIAYIKRYFMSNFLIIFDMKQDSCRALQHKALVDVDFFKYFRHELKLMSNQ
jgi:hypothetical protein